MACQRWLNRFTPHILVIGDTLLVFLHLNARAPPWRYHPYTIPSKRQKRVAKKIPGMNDCITGSWRDEGRIQVPLILRGILMAIYLSEEVISQRKNPAF